jgi:hypothetical protein
MVWSTSIDNIHVWTILISVDRMYNMQEEAAEMRRDETIMCPMREAECGVRGLPERLQVEIVRGTVLQS